MKAIKLTKKMLGMCPADLLVVLKATNTNGRTGYPNHVYFSKDDYRILESNVKKKAKKQYPGATKNQIDCTIGFEMLNYGPNQTLEDAIKSGYALVDYESIEKENIGRD